MLTRQHHICTIPGSLLCLLIPICLMLLSPPAHLSTALSEVAYLEFFAGADDAQKQPVKQSQNLQRDELEDMIVLINFNSHVNSIHVDASGQIAYSWITTQVITPPPEMKSALHGSC